MPSHNNPYPTVLVQGINDNSVRVTSITQHPVVTSLNGVYEIHNQEGIFTVNGLTNTHLKGELEIALEEYFESENHLSKFSQEFFLPNAYCFDSSLSKRIGRYHGGRHLVNNAGNQ